MQESVGHRLDRSLAIVGPAFAGLVLLAGAVLVAVSLLPLTALVENVDPVRALASGGGYTRDFLLNGHTRLRVVGSILLAIAMSLVWFRARVRRVAVSALEALPMLASDLRSGVLSTFRSEGLLHPLALAAVIVAAGLVRLQFLQQPMRYDEALTYNEFASRPLYYALSFYPEPNNHLFHTLLVRASTLLFGSAPWAIRLPAFLAGVLVVPATYALGSLLYDRRVGLLAAAAAAAFSLLVEYSTNARGYTLLTLAFVVTFALAVHALATRNRASLLLAASVAALGFYTVPTMLYAFGTVLAWAVLAEVFPRTGHRAVRAAFSDAAVAGAATGLLTFLVYVPPILVSGVENVLANRFVKPLPLDRLATELPASLASTWALWNRDVPLPLAALLALGFVVGTLRHTRLSRHGHAPLLAVVAWCLPVVLVQRVAPFERVWLFLLPLYAIVAMAGLLHLGALAVGWWRSHVEIPASEHSSAAYVDGPESASGKPAARGSKVTAGAGTSQPGRLPVRGAIPVLGVFLLAAMAIPVTSSRAIELSPETGLFRDAEAVTRTLAGVLDDDAVARTCLPASLPELQYYFARAGLDTRPLLDERPGATRAFLVAASLERDCTEERLAGERFTLASWTDPRVVATYESSALYELRRR